MPLIPTFAPLTMIEHSDTSSDPAADVASSTTDATDALTAVGGNVTGALDALRATLEASATRMVDALDQLPGEPTFARWLVDALGAPVIASLAGAAAGAWVAYVVVERKAKRQEAARELQKLNAALLYVKAISDFYAGFKRDIWRPLYSEYSRQRKLIHDAAERARSSGKFHLPFPENDFLFRSIVTDELPVVALDRIVIDQVTLPPMGVEAALRFTTIAHRLVQLAQRRDLIIATFHDPQTQPSSVLELYLGYAAEPLPTGAVHPGYAQMMDETDVALNDLLYYSLQVANSIHERLDTILRIHPTLREEYSIYGGQLLMKGTAAMVDPSPRHRNWEDTWRRVNAEARTAPRQP